MKYKKGVIKGKLYYYIGGLDLNNLTKSKINELTLKLEKFEPIWEKLTFLIHQKGNSL